MSQPGSLGIPKIAKGNRSLTHWMHDEWEKTHGFNPNDVADGRKDRNGDGYTNIEEYINGLVE